MNKLLCTAAVLSILVLPGCASNHLAFQPIMDPRQSPAMSSGYVAGMFSREWGAGKTSFGLGIVNTATAEEYVMPFGVDTGLPRNVIDEVVMIQLPPGEYRIAYWLIYSSKEKKKISQTSIPPESLTGSRFKLASGEVVFTGSHVAREERNNGSEKTPSVHHQRLTLRSAQKALSSSYPAFMAQPVSCPGCMD